MSPGLTFRKFRRDDLPRIAEFRKTFFPYNPSLRSHEPEYYEWKCARNPILPGEMWLAEDGETLVGMKGMTPKRIKILGAAVDGAETGDTFTRPDYQRRGIFTGLFKDAIEKHGVETRVRFIYGLPNRNSLPGYERKLNYAQVPIRLYNLLKPLNSKQLLKRRLPFPFLATISSPLMEGISQAVFKFGMRKVAKSNILVRPESVFPNDIDILWEQASKSYDIMLVRTRDYLEWRYVTNPDTYSILIARNQSGAILGYMVTKTGFAEDIPIEFIVDFLTREDDTNIFRKLLATAMDDACPRKVSVIIAQAVRGSSYHKVLIRLGFFPYSRVPMVCYKNELGIQVLSKPFQWHFTMGDSDNI